VTAEHQGKDPAPDWTDWRQWVEGTDWPDWRSWLQRISSADWTQAPWTGASWEQAAETGTIPLPLRAFEEDEPGDQIAAHLRATRPAFRRWWHGGTEGSPSAAEARARLEEHMPELVPTWQRLSAMLGEGNPLMSALEPSSGLLGKDYAKETEAESDHHLHIRTGPGRDGVVAEGPWRISLEAVDGWSLRADTATGREDDRGPFARLLGTP
jgi:hypothetical protein